MSRVYHMRGATLTVSVAEGWKVSRMLADHPMEIHEQRFFLAAHPVEEDRFELRCSTCGWWVSDAPQEGAGHVIDQDSAETHARHHARLKLAVRDDRGVRLARREGA